MLESELILGLVNSALDAIVVADSAGQIVFTNKEAEKVFGYTRLEFALMRVEELMPERFREKHIGHRIGYMNHPKPRQMGANLELVGLRKNGREFPCEARLTTFGSGAGMLVAARLRDVTVQRLVEADRRVRDERLRLLTENLRDYLTLMLDPTGNILTWNNTAQAVTGYSEKEAIGKHFSILHPSAERGVGKAEYLLEVAALTGRAEDEDWRVRKDGSKYWANVVIAAIRDQRGTLLGFAKVGRDITERRRFEEELKQKNEELTAANRAKDVFLASMSHELRTPLNAILGFTGTLLMKMPGPLNEEQEHQLRTVQKSGKHLLALINDLLDVAKIEVGKIQLETEAVNCTEIARDLFAVLRPAAEAKGLQIRTDIPAEDLYVKADKRALNQILLNLVSNAIKFTTEGTVTLKISEETAKDAAGIEFCVADTGIGIAEKERDKLFQAFSRTDASKDKKIEGTGLGLYLSQKLATAMGGMIRLESEAGKGSRFRLWLKAALVEQRQ